MASSIFPQGNISRRALDDFWRSSAIVSAACVGANGWNAQIHDPAATAAPSVIMYVWDSASGWIWVCSTSKKRFAETSQRASRERPKVVEAIRGKLGNTIYRAATGLGADPEDDATWENVLGSMLAAYAGTTQTWKLADGLRDGGHFIVMYYRKPGENDGMLRPFVLPESATGRDVLSVDRLRSVIRSVEQMDRARHPEWFAA